LPRRDDLETHALKLILDKGDEGILQSDMWRALDATSREGSRIALRLEAKNLIRRERELSNGRWTNRIYASIRRVNIDSLIDVPCMICEDIEKCEVGRGISAAECDELTQWLVSPRDDTSSLQEEDSAS
jgi:hypothetical protein